jgi:NADH:ubiquinone oxidoreductase subunit E
LKGAWRVLEGLAAEIRKRGLTDRFRVRARFCANNCDKGPSVTVGQHTVMHVDPDNVNGFIDEYLVPALGNSKANQ